MEKAEKLIYSIVISIMIILMMIIVKMSTTKIEEASRRQAEAFRIMTDTVTHLNATITSQRDAPLKVTLENLPPVPSVACTVTMPPEKKTRATLNKSTLSQPRATLQSPVCVYKIDAFQLDKSAFPH